MIVPQGRSAQQLAEVLTTLATSSTEAAAAQGAVERIAECFEAEVGAIVQDRAVVASVGFRHESVPVALLLEVTAGHAADLPVPGAGTCRAIVVPVPSEPARSLVLARSGHEAFSLEEVSLLRSMGRILATALDMLRLRDRVAASEARSRRIVETASEGIWLFDAEGATTFANDKMAEILGYLPQDMAALSLFDVLDERGKAAAARNLERRRRGLSDQLECAFRRKDGSYVWVLLNASPLHDNDGTYMGSVCMMSDITQRKRIEDVLHQREQQLAEAQRVAHLGSFEWHIAANRMSCSDELYRVLGVQPHDLEPTYEGYLAHVHPEDRSLLGERVGAAIGGADTYQVEYRIVRPGGQVVWVQARAEVLHDEAGNPRLMRGTVQDVTAAKRVEKALRETTARYRLLQRMASAANEASSLEEALQVAVDEICAHTGWAVGQAFVPTGALAGDLVPSPIWHLADRERFAGLPMAMATTDLGSGVGLPGRVLASGAPAWVSDLAGEAAAPVERSLADLGLRGAFSFPVLADGDVACILEFFSEEQIEPDDALLQTMGQVATQLSRVAERQRASNQLATARDAAMESSRLKSDFLATMSHEIRTPMNGVIGLTGLLLSTDLGDRQRQYAEGVQSAGEALLAIINDILDFSKIEAGKLELEVTNFDLVQVVEEAAGLVAQTAQRKGLELVAYCYPDLPAGVRGDPARLRQVLLNLASNAVKFTTDGEVVVRAGLEEDQGGTLVVRFEVTDTGIGIAAADRERIFEPFSQADASTTRRFGGTGLGLAISRRLVAAMGGTLGLDSEPGRGSTFWFTLPLGRRTDGVEVPSRPSERPFAGLRVLVVDDNDTNRLILRDQLAAWDVRAREAADGASALRALHDAATRGQPFDIALVDVCMPGMGGIELARRIADDPALAPRVVLLTSATDLGSAESREARVAACLTKPVRLSQLYDSLARASTPVPGGARLPVFVPEGQATGTKGHVLVVEDNANNQLVAVGILRLLGYRADVAANGFEALDALDRTDYGVVLMDCQMPEMDGFTATAEIRRREGSRRHTPVIAMTAGASEADRDRCLAAGMDDYLSKPVKPKDIDAMLEHWIGGAGSDAALAGAEDRGGGEDRAGGEAGGEGEGEVSVLDHALLDELRQISPDGSLLNQVVETFLSTAPEHLVTLRQVVGAGDGPGVRYGAHRLRGEAGTLGAAELARQCAELEELGNGGRLDGAPALLGRIEKEFDRAAAALRALVQVGQR